MTSLLSATSHRLAKGASFWELNMSVCFHTQTWRDLLNRTRFLMQAIGVLTGIYTREQLLESGVGMQFSLLLSMHHLVLLTL